MDYFNNLSYIISHLFLMLYIYLFIPHGRSKPTSCLICFSSFLLLSSTDVLKLNIFPDNNLCYFYVTLLQIFITQSTGPMIASHMNSKLLFIGLSASNYTIIGSVAALILHIYTKSTPLSLLGNFAVHIAILLILCRSIRNIWNNQYENDNNRDWWELCLIPAIFYCTFSCFAFFPHTLQEDPHNIPGILCLMITMLVSYVVVLRYIESDSNRQDIYWKNILFESYIKSLEAQYELVEESEKNIRILRHDIRHYISMIDHLLDEKNYEEIRRIIAHISDTSEENKVVKYCDNLIINSIISKMQERAKALGITASLDLVIPRKTLVNNYELAAVIANLFENAIICVQNYEKEKRYIDIKIRHTQDHLLIQTKNQCQEKLIFDSATKLPKSQKGKNHGLGMQSILAFSEKIDGAVDCYLEKGVFHIVLFAKF